MLHLNVTLSRLILIGLALLCVHFSASAEMKVSRDLVYGDSDRPEKALQSLDIYWQGAPKEMTQRKPVIIYIHGGGWAFGDKADVNAKPDYFVSRGYVFASINYRLRWENKLFDQLEDLALAISWIKKHAAEYGINPNRIILMGHEAGAHLASLIATDPRYLRTVNLSPKDIRLVVAIDSISYDVPRVLNELGSFVQRRQHKLIFGQLTEGHKMASPIEHVAGEKGIPKFALLYVADDEASSIQTQAFARRLVEAGVDTIMIPGNAKTRQTIDVELGSEGDAPTRALMAFINASS